MKRPALAMIAGILLVVASDAQEREAAIPKGQDLKSAMHLDETPLQESIRRTLAQTIAPDSTEHQQDIAASILYLSQVMYEWNPTTTREFVSIRLVQNIHARGVVSGLLGPTLALIDASYIVGAPEFAQALGPIVARLNPSAGSLLKRDLGLPVAYSRGVLENPRGALAGIEKSLKQDNSASAKITLGSPFSTKTKLGLPDLAGTMSRARRGVDEIIYGGGSRFNAETAQGGNVGLGLPNNRMGAVSLEGQPGRGIPNSSKSGQAAQNAKSENIPASSSKGPLSGKSAQDHAGCGECIGKVAWKSAEGFTTGAAVGDLVAGPPGAAAGGLVAGYVLGRAEAEKCASSCFDTNLAKSEPTKPEPTKPGTVIPGQPEPPAKPAEKPPEVSKEPAPPKPEPKPEEPASEKPKGTPDDPEQKKKTLKGGMYTPDYDGPDPDNPRDRYSHVISQSSAERYSINLNGIRGTGASFNPDKLIETLRRSGVAQGPIPR